MTGTELADWGEALLSAYDTWRAVASAGRGRAAVIELLRGGVSIVDCPRYLGVPWETVREEVTHGLGVAGQWSPEDWVCVEAVLHEGGVGTMGIRELGEKLGVSKETARRLCVMYGVQTSTYRRERQDSIRHYLRAGLSVAEVVTACAADGHDVTNSAAYMVRRRMVERGELSRDEPQAALAVVA